MTTPPLPATLEFDKSGAFYDMVSAFSAAIAGLESVMRADNPMNFKPGEVLRLSGKVHPVITIEPHLILTLMIDGHTNKSNVSNSLVCMLINTAYESVRQRNDKSPAFEFFRHVRNAASHHNRFHFIQSEPARPAHWRGKTIDERAKGSSNPLSNTQCFGRFVAVADALALLWDIESQI